MNKKLLLSIAALAVAAVAGYNVYQSRTSTMRLSDLALANVEALAEGDYNFPEDPFKGMGEAIYDGYKYENYCEYNYYYIYTDVYYENHYKLIITPKKRVTCKGVGYVACTNGTYQSPSTELDVKESTLRDFGLY